MAKEVFIIGDESRMVVKNFTKGLKAAEFVVQNIAPVKARVERLPDDKPIHAVAFLSEGIDFQVIRTLAAFHEKTGMHLYFIGKLGNIDLEDKSFFDKIPSTRFSQYSVEQFTKIMESNDREKKRVLVVDDEPMLLRSIKSWLGDDFEVSLVNSGEAALEFLSEKSVDLVLLDYKMPKMNGPEVLMRMRLNEDIKRTPAIFLTAANDRESVMNVMKMKPDGYILKSEPPEVIRKSVKDYFKNRIVFY